MKLNRPLQDAGIDRIRWIGNIRFRVEDLEDPLCGGRCGFEFIGQTTQLPHGPIEHDHVGDECLQISEGQGVLQHPAAAEPPEEPPGTRVVSRGLSVGPNAEFSVELPMANSSMLVLPMITAPAASRRSTTVAS